MGYTYNAAQSNSGQKFYPISDTPVDTSSVENLEIRSASPDSTLINRRMFKNMAGNTVIIFNYNIDDLEMRSTRLAEEYGPDGNLDKRTDYKPDGSNATHIQRGTFKGHVIFRDPSGMVSGTYDKNTKKYQMFDENGKLIPETK